MAVTFDAVGPSSAGQSATNVASITWTHTVAAGPCAVLVGIGCSTDASTLTATCGGTTMTSLGKVHNNFSGTSGFTQLWGLANVSTGAKTILVSGGGGSDLEGGSVSYAGADTVTPFGTAVTAPASAVGVVTAGSVTVAGTTAGNIVTGACSFGSATIAAGSGSTSRWVINAFGSSAAGNACGVDKAAGGSVTLNWTDTAGDWYGAVGVEVLAGAGGGAASAPYALLPQRAPEWQPGLGPSTPGGTPFDAWPAWQGAALAPAVVITATASAAGAGSATADSTVSALASQAVSLTGPDVLPGLPGGQAFEAWPVWEGALAPAGPVTITATASAAAAGSVSAVVTQLAPAAGAGAGAITTVAAQIAGATAAGAGAVTAAGSTAVFGTATAAAAGSVTDVVTQIAAAAATGAGAVTALAAQAATGTAAAAGAVTDVVTQIAAGAAAGAGVAAAAATQIAGASAAGAGAVSDVATQIATATTAGAGSVTAAGVAPGQGTATVAGAGAVTAVATQIAPAASGGAGTVTDVATQAATATAAAAGSVTAAATQIASATVAATSSATAKAAQAAVASSAGAGAVTAAWRLTSGPRYATAAADLGGGTGIWVNPGNADGAPDAAYATWTAP